MRIMLCKIYQGLEILDIIFLIALKILDYKTYPANIPETTIIKSFKDAPRFSCFYIYNIRPKKACKLLQSRFNIALRLTSVRLNI